MTRTPLLKKLLVGGALLAATTALAPAVAGADPVESEQAVVEAIAAQPSAERINAYCIWGRGEVSLYVGNVRLHAEIDCVGSWNIQG